MGGKLEEGRLRRLGTSSGQQHNTKSRRKEKNSSYLTEAPKKKRAERLETTCPKT